MVAGCQLLLAARNRLVSIVDDELDITVLFHDAIRAIRGISVLTFTDAALALEHFKINKDVYAMVISDLRMPGLNGMDLIKKIKDMNPFVRTILVTAFEIKDDLFQEYAKQEIINGFLQKPTHLTDLYTEVDKQLHVYKLQKQNSLINIK